MSSLLSGIRERAESGRQTSKNFRDPKKAALLQKRNLERSVGRSRRISRDVFFFVRERMVCRLRKKKMEASQQSAIMTHIVRTPELLFFSYSRRLMSKIYFSKASEWSGTYSGFPLLKSDFRHMRHFSFAVLEKQQFWSAASQTS